jgi:hypothetical protein
MISNSVYVLSTIITINTVTEMHNRVFQMLFLSSTRTHFVCRKLLTEEHRLKHTETRLCAYTYYKLINKFDV